MTTRRRALALTLVLAVGAGCGRQDASPPPDPTVVTPPSTTSTTAAPVFVEAEQACAGNDGPAIEVTIRGSSTTPLVVEVVVDDEVVASAPFGQDLIEVPPALEDDDPRRYPDLTGATVQVRQVETDEVVATTDEIEPFGPGGGCG